MLDTRELLVGLIRGRLRWCHPDLSLHELNLRMLEEIELVKRAAPGPWSFRRDHWQVGGLSRGVVAQARNGHL
jgi:hypothetical protein